MNLKLKKTKVTLQNASGSRMKVSGECIVYAAAPGGKTRRIRVIVSPDLRDKMLLGWRAQKLLGLLHESWPGVIKQEQAKCNQVIGHQEEETGKKKKKKKKKKEEQEFPVDKKYEKITQVLEEYRDLFRDELELENWISN